MSWLGILGKTALGLGAVAVPVVFAVAGAGQASADPGICVSGPFGYAYACLDAPGWVDWGPRWDGGWDNGWHGGHGDWEGDDQLTGLVESRLHLVPPFRRRHAEVPLGLDQPYWIEDPDLDVEFHVRAAR